MPVFGPFACGGYPEAERLSLVEEIHGYRVADPYRWLEDPQDPRTQQWCARQDDLFSRWQAGWRGQRLTRLRHRLAELADAGSVSVPVWRGGRQFFTRRGPDQEHEVLLTVSAGGVEQALIDPAALDPAGLTTLDGWFASCEGDRVAYLLSAGGSEQSQLRVLDVTSGETIDGPIDGTSHAGVAWLPGGTLFYYQRRTGQRTDRARARRLVYLHEVGSDPDQDIPVFGQRLDPAAFYVPMVSPDGRWLQLAVDWGTRGVDTYLADLAADGPGAPRFRALQQGVDAISEASFGRDGRIYVLTDRDAPNRRLCAADAARPDDVHWHTVLPEDPAAVLEDFAILDGSPQGRPLLLALRSRHALSELALHDLATGELLAHVPAPGPGTIETARRTSRRRPVRLVLLHRRPHSPHRLPLRRPHRNGDHVESAAGPRRRQRGRGQPRRVHLIRRHGGPDVHPGPSRPSRTGRGRRSCTATAAWGTPGRQPSARSGSPG